LQRKPLACEERAVDATGRCAERFDRGKRQRDRARVAVLGLEERAALGTGRHVDLLPLETQQFTLPAAGGEREYDQQVESGVLLAADREKSVALL
jgi:hypothetical protein